jgi:hypothetical protein
MSFRWMDEQNRDITDFWMPSERPWYSEISFQDTKLNYEPRNRLK